MPSSQNVPLMRSPDEASGRTLRVACVQMHSSPDAQANLRRAGWGVRHAVEAGAQVVLLPEKWHCIGEPEQQHAAAVPLDGDLVETMRQWCRDEGIWLIAGSIVELIAGDDRRANTSLVIDPNGEIVAAYRKIHMFDVDVAGVAYRESDTERPGDHAVVAEIAGVPTGLSICYDVRFPELFRALTLAGARMFTVPAAFTMHTGRDHWETLLRARAIENQAWVMAAGIIGDHGNGKVSYGRSMIVDPWGVVVACAPDREGIAVADIDCSWQDEIRSDMPVLSSIRPDAYHVSR